MEHFKYDNKITGILSKNFEEVLEQIGEDSTREGLVKTPERMAKARESVEDLCSSFGSGVDLNIQVISHEAPAKAIAEFAKENEVDLIALSTHGRSGFRRLAFGSVAEEVLRRSPVPVLSFPRAED